jgi:hypothetical protein
MARPKTLTVTEATVGNWFPVDRKSNGNIGFTVRPHLNSAGTYDVEFTVSNLTFEHKKTVFSRSTTTLTITLVDHGLTTNDDVIIRNTADFNGVYRVASTADQDTLTVTVADSGAASGHLSLTPITVDTLTDFAAVSGLLSGHFSASISALRLNATSVTTQPVDITINQQES